MYYPRDIHRLIPAVLLLLGAGHAFAQQNPSKEYIRLGDRVIAIENPSPATVSFGTVSPGTSLGVNAGTGSVAVNVTSNVTPPTLAWSVGADSSTWFHLTGPNTPVNNQVSGNVSSSITFSFDANPNTTSRTAQLTLSGNSQALTLSLTQAGTGGGTTGGTNCGAGGMCVSPTSFTLGSYVSATQYIQITGSTTWSATVTSGASWLTMVSASGGSQASFAVANNTTASQRSGNIRVQDSNNIYDIPVVQSAPQSITVLPSTSTLGYGAGISFSAYVDGVDSTSQVSWSAVYGTFQAGGGGYYTAPSADHTDTITATFGSRSGQATVTISSASNTFSVTSVTSTLVTNKTGTFTIAGTNPDYYTSGLYVHLKFKRGIGLSDPYDCEMIGGYRQWLWYPDAVTASFPTSQPVTLSDANYGCTVYMPQVSGPYGPYTSSYVIPFTFDPSRTSGTKAVIGQAQQFTAYGPEVQFGAYTIVGSPTVGPLTPATGTGPSQTMTAQYAYGAGSTGLKSAELLLNTSTSGAGACDVRYDNVAHLFYLHNDAGTGWLGGIAPGSALTIQNSQCTFSGTGSSASMAGNTLTLVAPLTFTTGFFGSKFVYLDAVDVNNVDSGLQQQGSWTVDQPPTVVAPAPSSGAGLTQSFNFIFSDVNGANDLSDMYALFNTTTATANACAVRDLKSGGADQLYLRNDAGTGWLGPVTPGTANTLSNSQCSLNALASSVSRNGNDLTMTAALTFASAFSGNKNIYLDAIDTEGMEVAAGPVLGTWTVVQITSVVLATLPAGRSLSADGGASCTAPCSFQWIAGSSHTITASTTPQSGGTGIQYVWVNWSDSGAASHSITVPSSATTYTANFTTQYYLTTAASPTAGGSATPVSGWYNSGSVVAVNATANASYQFTGFSGALTGSTTPQNITMSGAASVTANFTINGVPWYSASWSNRKAITVNHTKVSGGSNLTNFPVLISVTDANLKTVANGGYVGKADGTDILFTASDGITKLNHELESYNASTGQVIAWVQVPALSYSADTVIYTYYGNASAADQQNKTGTWDTNYKGVWHLGNGTTLNTSDSTGNNVLGATSNVTAGTGQAGGAASLTGSWSFISTPDSAALTFPAGFTASFWANPSSDPKWAGLLAKNDNTSTGWAITVNSTGQVVYSQQLTYPGIVSSSSLSPGTWRLVTVTNNNGSAVVYINGTAEASGSVALSNAAGKYLYMGANDNWDGSSVNWFPGSLDEVRLSQIARSSGWIATEYSNQNSPSTFFTPGIQESYGGGSQVATPTFSPVAGAYSSAQSVTISTTTAGATIYYTTDGSTPTTASTLYSSAINVSANMTLNAIATKSGMTNSSVGTAAYTIAVATPTFSPVAGAYSSAQSVTISTTTAGATIYYTTDGSTPTTASTLYSSAINVGANMTLNAIATKSGMTNSSVGTAAYTIAVATPTFSPVAGTYSSAQSVTISTTTAGATIYYTADGSTPTTSSTQYTTAISVSTNATLKAIAVKSGMTSSAVGSAVYAVQVATPTFSPVAGTYSSAQTVTISTTTSGASIRYTTDGSTPTSTTGTVYSSAVTVSSSLTLKAIAYKTGMIDSTVSSAAYVINSGPAWYNASWAHRKPVTIDHTKVSGGSNLTNFPVLISVTDANLKTVANGGYVGKTDGTDILFTASDGITKLNHELDSYNASTGQVIAWVQVPSLSPSVDTAVYTYYGNSSAADQQNKAGVWNSNYKGVWHLGQTSGTSVLDSTSNGFTGTKFSSTQPSPTTSGQISGAQLYAGGSDSIDVGSSAAFDTNTITFEAWIKVNDTAPDIYRRIIDFPATFTNKWDIAYPGIASPSVNQKSIVYQMPDGVTVYQTPTNSFSSGAWHHLAFVYNGSLGTVYIDSINQALTVAPYSLGQNNTDLIIGNRQGSTTRAVDGTMDEVRISNSARSAGWIATEYNNQNSPSTFFSVGAQQ